MIRALVVAGVLSVAVVSQAAAWNAGKLEAFTGYYADAGLPAPTDASADD